MWIVVVEEECGEAQCDVLLRWGTEGRTQQLHSSYRDKESSATGGFEEERERGRKKKKNQHMLTYGYNNRARNEMRYSTPDASHCVCVLQFNPFL